MSWRGRVSRKKKVREKVKGMIRQYKEAEIRKIFPPDKKYKTKKECIHLWSPGVGRGAAEQRERKKE